jgi:hypothetical protein
MSWLVVLMAWFITAGVLDYITDWNRLVCLVVGAGVLVFVQSKWNFFD